MSTPTASRYVIIVQLTALPEWLQLTRAARQEFRQQILQPILEKYRAQVSLRWLDAEAFNAGCSDIALFTTADLHFYYFLLEELRDTAFFAKPYFRLENITIGLEEGYWDFEQNL